MIVTVRASNSFETEQKATHKKKTNKNQMN